MRGIVGPYRFIGWKSLSGIEGTQFSMVLLQNEKVIFRTQSLAPTKSGKKRTWGSVTTTNTGPVHLRSPSNVAIKIPESTFSGYTLDMVSPATGEHWRFNIEFTQSVYWFQATPASRFGGFAANVTGGLVGGRQYSGLSSGNSQELEA